MDAVDVGFNVHAPFSPIQQVRLVTEYGRYSGVDRVYGLFNDWNKVFSPHTVFALSFSLINVLNVFYFLLFAGLE